MKSRVFILSLALLSQTAGALRATLPATNARLYLSGRDGSDAVDWDFRCGETPSKLPWTKIPVPSNWELHGFGNLTYRDSTDPNIGEYRRTFALPADWSGRRTFLIFDGSATDTNVKVNGRVAGPAHRGGFYRFKYDITSLLLPEGENRLEVSVAAKSTDDSVNRAERSGDYWNFSGIFRPVWLENVPAQFIEYVAIDARADGELECRYL